MTRRDVVVMGASAGGVDALREVMGGLPGDYPGAILVVLHLGENSSSYLPLILGRASRRPACHPEGGERIEPGRIYVAPPGHHLMVDGERITIGRGPKENGLRPSVDALFRSAARSLGPRVTAVLLTGSGDDGVEGLQEVKARGGLTVVQDPEEALFPYMVRNALQTVEVDATLRLAEIPGFLVRNVAGNGDPQRRTEPMEHETRGPEGDELEEAIVQEDKEAQAKGARPDEPSVLTCPECGGSLWEIEKGKLVKYRCHVGHVYSLEALAENHGSGLEAVLWTAVRMFEEKAVIAGRQVERARAHRLISFIPQLEGTAVQARACADALRGILEMSGSCRPEGSSSPTTRAGARTAGAASRRPIRSRRKSGRDR